MLKAREETPFQKKIFDIYYSLPKRSLYALYEYLKNNPDFSKNTPTIHTLKKWSKKYNWQERILQRDTELKKELEKEVREEILDIKANYRKVIRVTLNELIKSLKQYQEKEKKIEIRSIRDFREISQTLDMLINLDLNLIGESLREPIQIIISEDLLPKNDNKV